MDNIILILLQTVSVVTVIIIVGVRIEHRLTKVETDIGWLKNTIGENKNCCEGETEKESIK